MLDCFCGENRRKERNYQQESEKTSGFLFFEAKTGAKPDDKNKKPHENAVFYTLQSER